MNAANRTRRLWRAMKRQLKFKAMGCCGSSWDFKVSDTLMGEEGEGAHEQAQDSYTFGNGGEDPGVHRMSLAMALEFDRDLLKVDPGKHHKPLMRRLLEDIDGPDNASCKCCVCMERNKDAALISCGHTYCRPCSRQMWLKRGSCPLCNRPIDNILDIY